MSVQPALAVRRSTGVANFWLGCHVDAVNLIMVLLHKKLKSEKQIGDMTALVRRGPGVADKKETLSFTMHQFI
jgi:hypothetical protein